MGSPYLSPVVRCSCIHLKKKNILKIHGVNNIYTCMREPGSFALWLVYLACKSSRRDGRVLVLAYENLEH